MDLMFDMEMSKIDVSHASALSAVEINLGARITKYSEVRHKELQATSVRIDDVMARTVALESKGVEFNAGGGGRRRGEMAAMPHHLGRMSLSQRHVIEAQAAAWTRGLECADLCLQPYAPRKHGEIAKIKCADSAVNRVHFIMSKALEKKAAGTPPTWCAVERSPEAAAPKRRAREAAESIWRRESDKDRLLPRTTLGVAFGMDATAGVRDGRNGPRLHDNSVDVAERPHHQV